MTRAQLVPIAFALATVATAAAGADFVTTTPSNGRAKAINQNCATRSGCFPDDPAGFPVTISQPGSYQLTSNLDVRAEVNPENVTAIEVLSGDVTLDLKGFRIVGPVSCSGEPAVSCAPSGGGSGIHVQPDPFSSVAIHNGTVRGMGFAGVLCERRCEIQSLRVSENGDTGAVALYRLSIVRHVTAFRNGGIGIYGGRGVIRDNTAHANGDYGIRAQPGATVSGNSVQANGGNGIRCASCLLLDNAVVANSGYGVELIGGVAYGRNQIYENQLGAITGTGTSLQVDLNLCGLGTPCP